MRRALDDLALRGERAPLEDIDECRSLHSDEVVVNDHADILTQEDFSEGHSDGGEVSEDSEHYQQIANTFTPQPSRPVQRQFANAANSQQSQPPIQCYYYTGNPPPVTIDPPVQSAYAQRQPSANPSFARPPHPVQLPRGFVPQQPWGQSQQQQPQRWGQPHMVPNAFRQQNATSQQNAASLQNAASQQSRGDAPPSSFNPSSFPSGL